MQDLKEKLVAVLGFGREGKAVVNYLLKHGIKPVLFDQKPWDEWPANEQREIKNLGLNFIFGPDSFKELAGFDVAFRSPGIRLSNPEVAAAIGRRLIMTSQTKWFFGHCPAKIIGVTGTKGKGTTSALINEMLKLGGQNCYLTGNIGKVQPLDILEALNNNDWVVYELSSFQLQDLDRSPHIGVVLMITSEHLDYHTDANEYVQAKSAITRFQTEDDFAITNLDFQNSVKIGKLGRGQKFYFSANKQADCYPDNGVIYLKNYIDGSWGKITGWQLRGIHNQQNICAAALAASVAGCDIGIIDKAANRFNGLEHRLEFVAEKKGIKFYNDSFSTTPETAIAAINSFDEPEILILGGSSKNSDFKELGKVLSDKKNIKTIILIGPESSRIKSTFKMEPPTLLEGAKNMREIFQQISSIAAKGDVVLLSPACASFGMFKNYKDRGEQFKHFVGTFE